MENKLCGICLSYNPDNDSPGCGECVISGCQVSECQQGCIDWLNSGGPDDDRESKVLRDGHKQADTQTRNNI